jgi:hypothetical protein
MAKVEKKAEEEQTVSVTKEAQFAPRASGAIPLYHRKDFSSGKEGDALYIKYRETLMNSKLLRRRTEMESWYSKELKCIEALKERSTINKDPKLKLQKQIQRLQEKLKELDGSV